MTSDSDAMAHDCTGQERKAQWERYRLFIEDAADGLFETDLKGAFTFFNKAFLDIFGLSAAEMRLRSFRDFMDESDARIAFKLFNRIYRTGQKHSRMQWKIRHRDGTRRVLEISGSLMHDGEADKIGFRGIARDVTDKHLAAEALKASEECNLNLHKVSRQAEQRYRSLLEFLPYPVFAFNPDGSVSYINPAFEEVFGWTLAEVKGTHIPFVPEDLKAETRQGLDRLMREKIIHGFNTRRLTRDGRSLDIVLDGAVFYDEDDEPAGLVITLRDVTQEQRIARHNQALFRIANALHRFRGLDERLAYITREVQDLVKVGGASVILLDEQTNEFYFREAVYEDSETGRRMKEIRFPVSEGVAGQVYRSGKPLIVPDTSRSPFFFSQVDEQSAYRTQNMLDVPIRLEDRIIGVLCAVNKKEGGFDQADVALMTTIATMIALPIENARINEALQQSYEEVQDLNQAKDRVIHHLSHELKTPLSVLSASLQLLARRLNDKTDAKVERIMARLHRNLQRLLDMQYQIEDIMRERSYRAHYLLSKMLDTCTDALETVSEEICGSGDLADRMRERIDDLLGVPDAVCEEIILDQFVASRLAELQPHFEYRTCQVTMQLEPAGFVLIPPDVLAKVVDGLVRNAVENTPDGSRIKVVVRATGDGPLLEVSDRGVGITPDNQALWLDDFFPAYEPLHYSSGRPFDFNAGGKGFDLLRMKIFSERYHFRIGIRSRRCRFIPNALDVCPGDIALCSHCHSPQVCDASGGTKVVIQFWVTGAVSRFCKE